MPSVNPTPRSDLSHTWAVSVTAPLAEIVSAYRTRPSRSVYGCPAKRRGPLMFKSRIRTPLIALRYIPSTVSTVLYGSCRPNPADTPKYCGYLKFAAVRFTPTVPACPGPVTGDPTTAFGRAGPSPVNAGTVPAAVQLRRTRPSPVFA